MDENVVRIFTIILTILIGLAVGSFLNVLIYRVPEGMNIATPPSHCPKCDHRLKWYDNIPLLSYIILRGKCRYCGTHISLRYPLVELLNTVLWFICLMCFTSYIIPGMEMNWIKFITSCFVCSLLICIFFSDLDHMEIPDIFQLGLLICGLVLCLDHVNEENIMLKVFGFLGAGALFIITNYLYKLIRKREGIGFGDVELIACAGLILGGYNVIVALLLSCVVGGAGLLIYSLINKTSEKEHPFAVLLVPGILISLFVGQYIVDWYFSLLGV